MNENFVRIKIIDDQSFALACDLLHDSPFVLSSAQFDPEAGTWRGMFEREFFEDESLIFTGRKYFFFQKCTFPYVESELVLTGIKSLQVKDRAKIENYYFNELRIKGGQYIFDFCGGLRFTFVFHDRPQGTLIDRRLLEKRGNTYYTGRWNRQFSGAEHICLEIF